MSILQVITIYLSGILTGGLIFKIISKYVEESKIEKQTKKLNSQFKQILSNISMGKSIFKNRVNNTVFIGSNLEEHGDVDVIYMMDNKDVAIFKENKCIYTSEGANKEIVNDLTFTIEKRFKTQINDVVDILGFKFYREEFEKAFKVDMEDIKKQFGLDLDNSDIDKIKKENETRFDIDEILDKISKQGIDSLTFEERIFLDEYSRKNG
jgi:hypothetical protein